MKPVDENAIFSQVKGPFKVKLKHFSGFLAYTFRLLSEKHWVLLFNFTYKFKVLSRKSERFGEFYDKQIQSLIQRVLTKKAKI